MCVFHSFSILDIRFGSIRNIRFISSQLEFIHRFTNFSHFILTIKFIFKRGVNNRSITPLLKISFLK